MDIFLVAAKYQLNIITEWNESTSNYAWFNVFENDSGKFNKKLLSLLLLSLLDKPLKRINKYYKIIKW